MKLYKLCAHYTVHYSLPVIDYIKSSCYSTNDCKTCPYLRTTKYSGGHPSGAEVIAKVLKLEPE